MTAPEVIRILPGPGYADPESFEEIEIRFSGDMDRAKTERACTFSEGDTLREGVFRWTGDTLRFRPNGGFRPDRRYIVSIGNGAEDRYGNSLLREVNHIISTGWDQDPPAIAGTVPADGAILSGPREPISITFSEPMDRVSFLRAFSLSPDVTGTTAWDASGATVIFSPLEPYPAGVEMKVSIGTDAADLSGNTLPRQHRFRFTAGARPDLRVSDLTVSGTGALVLDTETGTQTGGIEKDDRFDIVFTEPVPPDHRSGILSCLPTIPYTLVWGTDFTTCRLTFDEPLGYGSTYELNIFEKRYRILVDGPRSLPIRVERVSFCNDIDAAVPRYTDLSLNASVTVSGSSRAAFDFSLLHSQGAEIDTASFLESASVSSSVLPDLVITSIRTGEPSGDSDVPGGAERTTVRLLCTVGSPVFAGIGRVSLEADLRDSFGNRLPEAWATMFQVLPE